MRLCLSLFFATWAFSLSSTFFLAVMFMDREPAVNEFLCNAYRLAKDSALLFHGQSNQYPPPHCHSTDILPGNIVEYPVNLSHFVNIVQNGM